MIIVFAEEGMIPGHRLEVLAAHEEAGRLLRDVPGFVAARLLHFGGGGYRYVYEVEFESREDWEAFFAGPVFAALHRLIDPHLVVPFGVQVHALVQA